MTESRTEYRIAVSTDPIQIAIDRIEDARRLISVCAAALRTDTKRAEDAAYILEQLVCGEIAEALAELRMER
jgi:hypothetical protein